MSDKVIGLHGPVIDKRQCSEECVVELEYLLEMARSGELVGFVGVSYLQDRLTERVSSGVFERSKIIGSLEILKTSIALEALED